MKIKGSNVTIMVTSMAKSIKFYTEVLGMKLIVQHGSNWAEVGKKGLTVGLHPIGKSTVTFGDNAAIGLEVDNIENAVKELQERKIEAKVVKDSYVHLAHFKDPSGNSLFFYKEK